MRPARPQRRRLARPPARRRGRAWSTACARTGPGRRSTAIASTPHKLLLDPYAREIVGQLRLGRGAPRRRCRAPAAAGRARQRQRSALKARVVHDRFDWQGDTPPATPWADTVLYELHVRGFTKLHPGVPAAQRGSYAGLASDAAIAHLQRLGITAVSLLPVHRFIDESGWCAWACATTGATTRSASSAPSRAMPAPTRDGRAVRDEFRAHGAAPARGRHRGDPRRGLQPHGRDRRVRPHAQLARPGQRQLLPPAPKAHAATYENHTGCGNTLDLRQPRVLQMVMDSLRYWVQEMHVDGFRFDLATGAGPRRRTASSATARSSPPWRRTRCWPA